MFPPKGVPSAVVWTVRMWCLDCAAGPEESSTSEIQQLWKREIHDNVQRT